jgi:hypothetical protein
MAETRKLVGVVAPPKPIREMTEAEIDAWCEEVGAAIQSQYAKEGTDEVRAETR